MHVAGVAEDVYEGGFKVDVGDAYQAESMGARYRGQPVGSGCDIACVSVKTEDLA